MFEKIKFTSFYNLLLPLQKTWELTKWNLTGYGLPIPHIVKEEMISEFALKHKIKNFVETGTYLGVMVDAQKNNFDMIYSIELNKSLHAHAKLKFRGYKYIKLLNGDSGEKLKEVLRELKAPALFWLDAHFSGGITSRGKKLTPILIELRLIKKRKYADVILIDDANLFDGTNDYPTLADLKKSGYKLKIKNNVIIVS